MVVSAPPPEPHIVGSTQITHFQETGGVTVYHIKVFAVSGQQWEVAARYSSFEALSGPLGYAGLRVPFPGKKPLRSLFGLQAGAKEERRAELEQWLAAAVAASAGMPWVRTHLHAFLRCPEGLRAPVPVAGQAASPNIQVQMPAGVAPGEVLEIELHGQVYNIPAPAGVAAGATFEVELPSDEPQAKNPHPTSQQWYYMGDSCSLVGLPPPHTRPVADHCRWLLPRRHPAAARRQLLRRTRRQWPRRTQRPRRRPPWAASRPRSSSRSGASRPRSSSPPRAWPSRSPWWPRPWLPRSRSPRPCKWPCPPGWGPGPPSRCRPRVASSFTLWSRPVWPRAKS